MTLRGFAGHIRLAALLMAHDGGPGAPPRRPGLWTWLGIAASGVLVVVAIVSCSSAGQPGPSPPSSGTPSPSAAKTAAGPASTNAPVTGSALGPSACVTTSSATAGSGPWKLISPRTLCGLPLFDSAQYVQSGQSLASMDKMLFSMNNIGPVTATVTLTYQSPKTPNFYRSVAFVGFEGTFRPAAALSAMEQPGYTYASEPPGPHGGMLACAKTSGPWDCVWATPTTVCDIEILDTTGDLIGANIAVNAVRIRDALEAPA
jgi:hypothetical protein